MILCLEGTDIRRFHLAIAEKNGETWKITRQEEFFVSPETYLATLAGFLAGERPEAIAVHPGPGSATALRSSLAIANTLAFAWRIPISAAACHMLGASPCPLPEQMFSVRSVCSPAIGELCEPSWRSSAGEVQETSARGVPVVLPIYANEPHLATSSRDALRRPV